MGNETQVNPEGCTSTGQSRTGFRYGNYKTTEKPSFKRNTTKIKYSIFTQGHPSDAEKYEELIKNLINYVQREYSAGVYLGQSTLEGKVSDLALPIQPMKDNNQPDAEFDLEVFKCKENEKTVFGKSRKYDK